MEVDTGHILQEEKGDGVSKGSNDQEAERRGYQQGVLRGSQGDS